MPAPLILPLLAKAAPLLAKAAPFLKKSAPSLLQSAPAIGGLLFGENNIFSGKGRQAAREGEKAFQASQNMGIGQGYYDVLNSMQSRANRGLGASTLGLMERSAGRNTTAGLGALKGKRSLLAGAGSVLQAGQDAAMNIGAANEQALSSNRREFDQTRLQIAGLEQENMLRKNQEAKDYWQGRRAESNQAISSNLAALGKAAASSANIKAMNEQNSALASLGDLFKGGAGQEAGQVMGQGGGALSKMPFFNRLPAFSSTRMMGGQYSGLSQPSRSNLLRTPKFGG
jgi:hypothetical protein